MHQFLHESACIYRIICVNCTCFVFMKSLIKWISFAYFKWRMHVLICSRNRNFCLATNRGYYRPVQSSGVASVDNWRGEYSYIVFYIINFFWNLLLLRSVNTRIWIFASPIINAGYPTGAKIWILSSNHEKIKFISSNCRLMLFYCIVVHNLKTYVIL